MAEFGMTRTKTSPVPTPRTSRFQDIRNLTSLPAGRVVPVAAIPLLREDSVRRCALRLSFEMMETTEILMNGVFVNVQAHLVSNLAMDRFDGMDALNRSYAGVAVEGLTAVPFMETGAAGDPMTSNAIMKYLGMHFKTGDFVNTAYIEAYNQIWNYRARNRSQDLNPRTRLDPTLAPAFWQHQQFRNVVPDFDQAVIDGEVPLNVIDGKLFVKNLGWDTTQTYAAAGVTIKHSDGTTEVTSATDPKWSAPGTNAKIYLKEKGASNFPDVFAELKENGVTVSLSNIELARKTQAFARIMEQYQGISEDYIVDLLMQGIGVPEQELNQPILLGEKATLFGMSKRYSTDADALTESVVNGATFLDLTFRTPAINTGGIVMVTAEILPEQLFERQRDPYLYCLSVDQFPDYLRDTLDPEKVEVVQNGQVDAAHATPTGTFGYAPLNWKWMMQEPRIGGKFYRSTPSDTTNDEVRQRLWAVESVNPQLAADFYIATNINTKPFVVTNADPFEVVTRGMCVIEGNTVFGGALVESTGSYDEIMSEVDDDRIVKPAGQSKPVESDAEAPVAPAAKPSPSKAKK